MLSVEIPQGLFASFRLGMSFLELSLHTGRAPGDHCSEEDTGVLEGRVALGFQLLGDRHQLHRSSWDELKSVPVFSGI